MSYSQEESKNMSTSPLEVHKRQKKSLFGALAFCLMALGMVGGTAQAADPLTLTSHSPTHYPSPGGVNVPLDAPIVLNFNGAVENDATRQGNLLSNNGQNSAKINVTPSTGQGGQPLGLQATFSNGNKTITLTHSVNFDEQTFYVVEIRGLIADDANNAGEVNFTSTPPNTLVPVSGGAVNPFTFRTLDTRRPFIENHNPVHNDSNMNGALNPTTGTVRVTFNEPMEPTSVINNTTVVATLPNGTQQDFKPNLDLALESSGQVLTISLKQKSDGSGPVTPWPGSKSADNPTRITVTVAGNDLVGLPLQDNPSGVNDTNRNPFTFRTADTIAPGLASSSPSAGQANVPTGTSNNPATVVLNFDEPIDTANFRTQSDLAAGSKLQATVLLLQGDITETNLLPGTITAAFSNSNKTVTLTSSFPFPGGTNVRVVVPGSNTKASGDVAIPRPASPPNPPSSYVIRDAVGNVAGDTVADFTFGTAGGVAPTIASISPTDQTGVGQVSNANRVSVNSPIIIRFTGPVNQGNFKVELRQKVPGKGESDWPLVATTQTFSDNGQTVTIQPTSPLVGGNATDYQLRIVTAEGTNGLPLIPNSLAPGNTLTFRTQDLTPPAINSLNPDNGANILPESTQVQFGFTEPVRTDQPIVVAIRYARSQDDTRPVPPLPKLVGTNVAQEISRTSTQVLYQVNTGAGSPTVSTDANGNTVITLNFIKYLELAPNGDVIDTATDPRNTDSDPNNNVGTDPSTNFGVDAWAFAPGETTIFQVVNAQDLNNNQIQPATTPKPNPWIYTIIDVRPPKVIRAQVGGIDVNPGNQNLVAADPNRNTIQEVAPLVALNAPVVITFSKPMGTGTLDRMTFKADGNWCASADILNAAGTGYEGCDVTPGHDFTVVNQWQAKQSSYSADLRSVTLTHSPFDEANINDTNVTDRCDGPCADLRLHTFQVLDARDQPINGVSNGVVNPNTNAPRANSPEQANFSYLTSSRPRVINIEFERALPDGFDPNGKTEADLDAASDNGGAAGSDPDKAGLIGSNRQWDSFSEVGYQGYAAVVPLNSRLRFSFSGVMNQSTVPAPQFTKVPQPVLGWTAAWNAQSNQVVWSHSDLFAGPNEHYRHQPGNTSILEPDAGVYQGLTQGNGVDIKGDSLFNNQTGNPNNGVAVPAANMNTVDVTGPSMTLEYLANVNNTTDAGKILCVGGAQQAFDGGKAIWKPLAGATDVPLNTVIRIRTNETMGPGGPQPDSSIAMKIEPQGKNNPGTTADSDAGRAAAATQLGLNAAGQPGTFLSGESPLSAAGTARMDNTAPDPDVVGAQTLFKLNLVSPAGATGGDQGRGNYSLKFTVGDTRLDDDGRPANNGQNLPDNVGGVPGNQAAIVANFSTEDVSAPVVRSITGGGTALNVFTPETPIVVDFDEPVDINTVNIETISRPDGTPAPAFTKAYGANGNDKSIVVFTPTTPLVRPASGAANNYVFRIKSDVLDLRSSTSSTCNAANKQTDLTLLNGNGTDRFTISVPVETVPPTVRSFVSTREELTIQFSEAVISSANNDNGDFARSARNPQNYYGTYKAAQVGPTASTQANFQATADPNTNDTPTRGFVTYTYFDPNRTQLVNGNLISAPGTVTALKRIRDIRYDATANAVTLIVDPMTEGQGTSQPETVYVSIPQANQNGGNNTTIFDVNTNPISQIVNLQGPVQTGRADWVIQTSVTSNVPGASPDANNFFGVRGIANADGTSANGSATVGYDGPETDIAEPLAPGANHVFMYSARGNDEPGFQGNGGNFAQDIQSRPQLEESRTWPRLGVSTDLGATGAPATITMNWNLNLPGREVPATHSVELLNLNPRPGEPTSIDMRSQSSFSYTVENNGLDQTRFFSLVVTAPGVQSSPFQLAEGFNMVGVPVRAQNPAVSNVFFGLSPLVVYRYDPAAGYEIFPSSSAFTTVEPGRGYFVRPRSAGYQLRVLGVPIVGQTTIGLKRGWNLIADPFNVPVNGANILARTASGDISVGDAVRQGLLQDAFFTYDPATRGYTSPEAISTGTVQPWKAYWVLSFEDVTLVFNKPTQVANP